MTEEKSAVALELDKVLTTASGYCHDAAASRAMLALRPAESYEKAMALFPILKERRRQPAGTLSGGEQQMLAIGRALMSAPQVLLLDEPSMGLSPLMTQQVFDVLQALKKQGMTILLVEQNAYEALTISDRAYIMETGSITLEGRSSELIDDPRVKDAYLGGDL